MSGKRQKREILKKKLLTKNRLVILNEATFEEIFSLKLNLLNVFIGVTGGSIFLIAITTYIIAFTPLREYIPGYASTKLKKEATQLALQSDSLEKAIKINNAYIESIKKVLSGDVALAKLNKDSIIAAENTTLDEEKFKPTAQERKLREQVAQEDKYNFFESSNPKTATVLFPPVKGHITDKYDPKSKHLALDVAVPKNTPIKSIANGTVIFADWTPSNGNVIVIKHNNELVSVYKHAGNLTKSQGAVVKTGEVIAMAGTTGKNSTGVHLHFELWKDGFAVDPTKFIDFE